MMKGKAVLSFIVLGLTFPLSSFASSPLQTSVSDTNPPQFSRSENMVIVQRYTTPQYVYSRLYNSESDILNVAREYSGSQVNWKDISVEILDANTMKLDLFGKVPVGGWMAKDSNIRVGLYLQRDRYGNFQFVNYDFRVWGGTFPGRVRAKARQKLENLPNHFPRFQQVLNHIIV